MELELRAAEPIDLFNVSSRHSLATRFMSLGLIRLAPKLEPAAPVIVFPCRSV